MRNPFIPTLLLLALCHVPAFAQTDQATFEAFSWEGFSLSMTADEMTASLEGQLQSND